MPFHVCMHFKDLLNHFKFLWIFVGKVRTIIDNFVRNNLGFQLLNYYVDWAQLTLSFVPLKGVYTVN